MSKILKKIIIFERLFILNYNDEKKNLTSNSSYREAEWQLRPLLFL